MTTLVAAPAAPVTTPIPAVVAAPPPVAVAPVVAPPVAPVVPAAAVVAAPAAPTAPVAPVAVAPDAAAVAQAAADKAAAEALAAAPLDLKYPEGFKGDPAALEAFKPVAKELGLDAPKAQKLVEFFAKGEQARLAAIEIERAANVAAIKADPVLGGANLDKTIAVARAGVAAVEKVSPGIQKWLDAKGIGDDPIAVRLFKWIGEAQKEDTVAGTSAQPGAVKTQEQELRELFNHPTSQKMSFTG